MADELKATPENKYLAELSKALEWMAHPTVDGKEIKSRGPTIADLLPFESAGKFAGRLARGEPLTTGAGGIGGTTRLQPDVADFALDVAPFAVDVAGLAGRGAKGVAKIAGEGLSSAAMGQGPNWLKSIVPQPNFVVKPKGGNWLKGNVEKSLEGLKSETRLGTPDQMIEFIERQLKNPDLGEEGKEVLRLQLPQYKKEAAINNWVDKNLTNYIKNQMATPEDPVRKLAEKGIIHIPPDQLGLNRQYASDRRRSMEGSKLANSPEAQAWEDATDVALSRFKVKNIGLLGDSFKEPWHEKADPETNVYFPDYTMRPNYLGFDHIIDVLKEDLANGRLRPESLKNVSMEQAVSRAHEYNEDKAKKMAEAQIKMTEGMPTVKEYPTGHKWIELTSPKTVPEGYTLPEGMKLDTIDHPRYGLLHTVSDPKGITQIEATNSPESALLRFYNRKGGEGYKALVDALKYEGDTMGHCVGGYCPDVVSGESRIFSLRDAKGEPHVTVEVGKSVPQPRGYQDLPEDVQDEIQDKSINAIRQIDDSNLWDKDENLSFHGHDKLNELKEQFASDWLKQNPQNELDRIVQIKGKQNRAPNEQYLPFVQDFVKSGSWSDVGDLQNTGLNKVGNQYLTTEELKPKVDEAKTFLDTHPAFEQHRQANRDYLDAIGKEFSTNEPVYTRHEMDELERRSVQPLHPTVPYTFNEMKAGLNNPEEYDADSLGRRLADIDKLRQIHGDVPQPTVDLGTVGGAPEEAPKMKRGGKVRISDNPDVMQAEIMQRGFAGGGTVAKMLERAAPKTLEEIRAIAERLAPQVTGEEFIRGAGTQSIAGKTQKQFAREKDLPIDIRPDKDLPPPDIVDLAKHKGKVMIGIKGDPTVSNQTLHSVGDVTLQSPSPQHGGPMYGHGNDAFWASGLGAAKKVQNLAKAASEQYNAPVLGNYVMMGPDSYYYAQHFADANLNAIDPSKMTKAQMEALNDAIRRGGPLSNGPRPNFPGIEDVGDAYLQMQMDPGLRKHFNELMTKANTSKMYGVPSGQDIAHAVTVPSLRNLEIGVTGQGIGEMYPDQPLPLSTHPTYSHDIPGKFLGSTQYPIPYELSFPDTTQAIRANPKQGGSQEFGSFGMVGPRQIIDQQLIDELGEYQRQMKSLTGKKKGGAVKTTVHHLDGEEVHIVERTR